MLLHILIGFTKEMAKNMKNLEYIRILGFNDKGRNYLNSIKKDVEIPIISKFIRDYDMLKLELDTTIIYNLVNNDKKLIEEEYKNHLRSENYDKN